MNLKLVRDHIDNNSGILTPKFLRNKYDEMMDGFRKGNDVFFSVNKLVESLKNDYKTYGRMIVAYDFDDTVCPSKPEYHCDNVIRLLQLCSTFNDFEMICYTARSTSNMINDVRKELDRLGIRYDTINDNVPRIKKEVELTYQSKVLYSVFLDNRAGLKDAYMALVEFLDWYCNQPAISE